FVGKHGVKRGIDFGEPFDRGAQLRIRLNQREASARFNSGISGRHEHANPFFSLWILGLKEEDFARPFPVVLFGAAACGRQKEQRGSWFVVAGEVIEILILGENVGLRVLFVPGQAEQHDGAVNVGSEFRAAFGIDGIGFAPAPLLRRGGKQGAACHQEQRARAPGPPWSIRTHQIHSQTTRHTTHSATSESPRAMSRELKIVAEKCAGCETRGSAGSQLVSRLRLCPTGPKDGAGTERTWYVLLTAGEEHEQSKNQ